MVRDRRALTPQNGQIRALFVFFSSGLLNGIPNDGESIGHLVGVNGVPRDSTGSLVGRRGSQRTYGGEAGVTLLEALVYSLVRKQSA